MWRENMLGHLSADIICSEKQSLEENCELRGTDNIQGQISEYNFTPNGGCCLVFVILNGYF